MDIVTLFEQLAHLPHYDIHTSKMSIMQDNKTSIGLSSEDIAQIKSNFNETIPQEVASV